MRNKLACIFLLAALALAERANALIVCDPPTCTPSGCGSCCDYKTCDLPLTVTYQVTKLPFPLPEPADACDYFAPNPLTQIPKDWVSAGQPVEIRQIQKSLAIPYKGCQTRQNCSPPCPPPPGP